MKPVPSYSNRIRTYNTGYVVVLLLAFLFVMFMGARKGAGDFDDNFYYKNLLIENFNRIRLNLGDRVFNSVLVGKNGWMEYMGEGNLDDFQNAQHFSRKTLRTISQNLENCYEYAEERGMTFLVVVAPNKATIYPDKLPDQIQPLSGRSRLDQLLRYLERRGIRNVLDLRPILLKSRQKQDIYYQMGTHWNEPGAYVAYSAIINALAQEHPELEPYPEDSLGFHHEPRIVGDTQLSRLIQANYLRLEPTQSVNREVFKFVKGINLPGSTLGYHRITWIPESDLPTLIVFHDSFGVTGLNSFLSLSFSKVSYIFRQASPEFLNWRTIEMFAPDIVIYQVVERNLGGLETDLSGCAVE